MRPRNKSDKFSTTDEVPVFDVLVINLEAVEPDKAGAIGTKATWSARLGKAVLRLGKEALAELCGPALVDQSPGSSRDGVRATAVTLPAAGSGSRE